MSSRGAITGDIIALLCAADAGLVGLHETLSRAGFSYKATARPTKSGGVTVRVAWRKRTTGTSIGFTGTYRYSPLDVKTARSVLAERAAAGVDA